MSEFMNKDALKYLVETGASLREAQEQPQIITVEGRTFLCHGGRREEIKPVDPEQPSCFHAYTLQGLVDFIKHDTDGLFTGTSTRIVQVCGHDDVTVLSGLSEVGKNRYALAMCDAKAPTIHFDRYMDAETFIVMLLTRFEKTHNRDLLLTIVGNLKQEESITQGDDGFSQRITIKKGVVTVGETTVENPVMLKPLRTFKEVDQPESLFTLRFREGGQVALFESDGGAWKNEAVARTKAWLDEQLEGADVVVIA